MQSRYIKPDTNKPPFQRILNAIAQFDGRSWIIMILFFAVLSVAALLNAYAMSVFFVPWLAYSLSGFMEIGTLVWKVADERKQNSDYQKKLTSFVVWANVIMFSILLLANLIRVALRSAGILEASGEVMTTWDFLAFGLISVSALGHVVGPLLFREWDTGLQHRRALAQQLSQVKFEDDYSKGVLESVRARLQARNLVYQELQAIRQQYAGSRLPPGELESLLEEAKAALEIKYNIDYDNNGVIGPPPALHEPSSVPGILRDRIAVEEEEPEFPSPKGRLTGHGSNQPPKK